MKSCNFKIEALATTDGWITKGKIYEFKGGQTIWDDGSKSSDYVNYTDLEESMSDYLKFKEYDKTKKSISIHKKKSEKIKGTAFICYDISGSIDNEKKSYYKKVYDNYDNKYENVSVISHTTVAKFSNINDVLNKPESGGTYISSPLRLIMGEVILRNNPLDVVVLCGDGDNWSEDNDRVIKAIDIIISYCKVDYFEFLPSTYTTTMFGKLNKTFKNDDNLKSYKITDKKQNIFGIDINRKESFDISIKIDNYKTVARIGKDIGVARCNPNDEYNKEEGIRIAVSRALGIEPFED